MDYFMGAYFQLNHPSMPEREWKRLRTKFFEYLGQHQEEWKAIKEENPLDYMPYMESHFEKLTGVKLTSLSRFTGWIKQGSFYPWSCGKARPTWHVRAPGRE